jgi:uncharacterized protein involved in exopolysaccharide biosynthesis
MPREDDSQAGLAAQLAQLGGLSELTGIRIGSSNKQEPLGVLRSRGFARRFIEASNLADQIARELVLGWYRSGPVDLRRVVDEFKRSVLLVTEDKKSGIVTVAVHWVDADLAAQWANMIVRQVNDEMRLRALRETERNIQYLRSQLVSTDTVSLQQAIGRLLESEMQKAMLARGTNEYAFRVIDLAEPPIKAAKPRRSVIVVVTVLASAFLSVLTVLLVHAIRDTLQTARGK